MFALESSAKIRFLLCFLPFLESSWWFSTCHRFSFFARTTPGLECFQGLYQVTYHCFGVGEKMLRQKKQIGVKKAIWKKRFFRFYAIIAADTGFWSAALEQCKNTTKNKKWNFSKCFIELFFNFFFNFRTLVRYVLDHWYNFFYSHYFCFKLGRMLQDTVWKCTATFWFFCVWYWRYHILHEKNDQNFPKKSKNLFFYFPKNLHNYFINIFANFGFWPTFSVPNEFF